MPDSNSREENPINVALREVFGPIVRQSSKLPAPLAYGTAIVIAILVMILLGAVIPENLIWLIGIIIIVCLVAFVFIDWDTRHQKVNSTKTMMDDTDPLNLPRSNEDIAEHMLEAARQMKGITGAYVKDIRYALEPNSLEEFVKSEDLPDAGANRPQRWYERVIQDGMLRGRSVPFLEDYQDLLKVYIRFRAVVDLISDEAIRSQSRRIITLVEERQDIYSQRAGFVRSKNKKDYRKAYLRKHIEAVGDLDTELSKVCIADR